MLKSNQEISDIEVINLTLKNKENFRLLIGKYELQMRRYIKRQTFLPEQELEEIVQDVFINVYKNLNAYNQELKFSSWIYRIAHNSCIDYLRKSKRIKYEFEEASPEYSIFDRLTSDVDLPKEVERGHKIEIIYEVLNKLDANSRDAIILKYFEEKDYSEISDILKVPEGSVGSLISRGKDKLKLLLVNEKKYF